jgi:hypothetical protein
MTCPGPPRSTTATLMSLNTMFRSCSIPLSRSLAHAAAPLNAPFVSGLRLSQATPGASDQQTTWPPRWLTPKSSSLTSKSSF